MRTVAFCLFTWLLAHSTAYPQGTIFFHNHVGQADAPVAVQHRLWFPEGTPAGALGAKAQLLLVTGGINHVYTPLSPTTTFRQTSSAAQYYVEPVTVVVPGFGAGEHVTIAMGAWVGEGSRFDAPENSLWGVSKPITVQLGGSRSTLPPIPDGILTGLQGFNLIPVPEPSSALLWALGGLVLLRGRMRRDFSH